ncbi:MAG: DUF1569 domain-containing protein [Gemmatimonadaceae bacterium]|nr:DUF1569 domain-containing protein [Gemmatimonadaceae bacterium]
MPTLANAANRDALIARLERLSPDAPAAWGRMNAPQMLAHCADALRMGLGDLPVQSKHATIPRMAVFKWLFLNVLPFPKSAPTAKELVSRAPESWETERAQLIELMQRVGGDAARSVSAEHPLFGPLSRAQWGQLAWKHLDHHLRQFGA